MSPDSRLRQSYLDPFFAILCQHVELATPMIAKWHQNPVANGQRYSPEGTQAIAADRF